MKLLYYNFVLNAVHKKLKNCTVWLLMKHLVLKFFIFYSIQDIQSFCLFVNIVNTLVHSLFSLFGINKKDNYLQTWYRLVQLLVCFILKHWEVSVGWFWCWRGWLGVWVCVCVGGLRIKKQRIGFYECSLQCVGWGRTNNRLWKKMVC